MISSVKDAITQSGGWIVDFRMFSNVSISLNFEIPVTEIARLYSALKLMDIQWSRDSEGSLPDSLTWQTSLSSETKVVDIRGALQLTFIHNEPDLRIEVPAIPG